LSEKVEIVWPEKETRVKRVSLPFQTVEMLTENRILKRARLDKWVEGVEWPKNYPKDWKNRLVWGDNKYIMSSLIRQGFAGKIDLIYIDPPFATGADFSVPVTIGDVDTIKEASILEQIAYRDTWGKGLISYLQMMYERLVLMKELLSNEGTIYVHMDWHVGHYVKIIMDEIFDRDNFLNDIIWNYKAGAVGKKTFGKKHDIILRYSKSNNVIFNADLIRIPYAESTLERLKYAGAREKDVDKVFKRGGKVPTDVWDIGIVQGNSLESCNFPTQKPEELLKRIILASSNEGSLIADFFCGSGTTGVVAEKLGRRWIMSDLSKFAIHVTRKRLLDLHNYSKDYSIPCRPFRIENLGSYQKYKFVENKHPPIEEYRKFILELYNSTPMDGYAFVHGRKGNRFVHIAGVDSIVTIREVEDSADECANRVGGRSLDILGWDFELGLDKAVEELEKIFGIDIALKYIPREAEEIKRVAEAREKIKFFDLSYVEVEPTIKGRILEIKLKSFAFANPEYIPDEVRKMVKHYTDYIDYWAIDFDYRDDVFHNMWQSFRTTKDRSLAKKARYTYESEGKKKVLVKVIDVFGNDSNRLIEVEI